MSKRGQEKLLHFLHTHVGSGLPDWLEVRAPVEDVAALLGSADVFVSASREDAFSYAIGEAMAAGLPVVSSDIPGPAHYFEAGGVFTYPVEDANDLARLLGSLGDSEQRNELGRKNRDFVRTHLGIERHVEGIIALYERLLVGRH